LFPAHKALYSLTFAENLIHSKIMIKQPSLDDSGAVGQQLNFVTRLCELEEYTQAESYLKMLLQKQPENSQIWFLLSYVAAQQKQYPLAIQHIKKAIELDPQEISFYSNLGTIYTNQKQYILAIQYYQKAITIQPENRSLYKSLGFVYGLQGDMAAATFNYAIAEEKNGNLLAAAKYYQKAIAVKPDYVLAYYNLGCLYHKQESLERAIECYQKVTQLQQDHLEAYYILGLIYQAEKLYSPAIYNYEQVVKLQPNYQEAYLNLSLLYKEQGNLAKAFEACQNAIQFQAATAKSFNPLGHVILENKQLPQQIQSQTVTKEQKPISEQSNLVTKTTNVVFPERSQIVTVTKNSKVLSKPAESNVLSDNNAHQQTIEVSATREIKSKIEYQPDTFNFIEKELIVQRIEDNKYNFIVTAFFAENNFKDALSLLNYLDKTELSYCLYQTPTIHQSASITGDKISTDYTKPSYFTSLYQTLIERELGYERQTDFTHILYLNTPLFFTLKPITINYLHYLCDRDIDFAIYNRISNYDISAKYSEQFESNLLFSCAAIQLYSLSSKSLLIWHTWQQAILKYSKNLIEEKERVFPGDETFMDYAWNNILRYQSEIKYTWLTKKHLNCYSTPLARNLIYG
jgi:tetratricopeptide (TPR) repeat protein